MADKPVKVTETVRDEIENEVARDRQMRRHDELWRRERNKIATASDPYPDFDLGSRGHRNIQRDYDERRAVWEEKRDVMEESFAVKREDIRAKGQTLSDEFTTRRTATTCEFTVVTEDRNQSRAR